MKEFIVKKTPHKPLIQDIEDCMSKVEELDVDKLNDTNKLVEDIYYGGSEGLSYTLNDDDGYTVTGIGTCTDNEVVIPYFYEGKPVTSIGNRAFQNCTSLTNITIPNSVTSIGSRAFFYCTSLTNITIPNSVTSIDIGAFRECTSLTNITIPNSVTSIGTSVFSNCTSLTNITIPNSVTSIGDLAFSYCNSLTNITIPNSVTSIYASAFQSCTSLTIYCEAISKPSRWNSSWNPDNCPVVWGAALNFPSVNDKINEIDGKTVDKVKSIDTRCEGVSELDIGEGISWREGFAFFNGYELEGDDISTGDIFHRIPIVAGDGIEFENEGQLVKINSTGGGSGGGMISTTYSELKALRDNSQLIPGTFYRITDYVCTTSQENTKAMNNKFDIIVQALSPNTLSENASADHHRHAVSETVKIPFFMDSVITNKVIKSLVNIYYTEFTDVEELLGDYRVGSSNEDILVEYGYQENVDGDTVPVLYKTDYRGVDPTRPNYNPEYASTDYEDVFYYVGTTEVDGVTYDRWRKIDNEYPWDSDSQIYIYTDVIVQDGSIELDSESLLIEVEGEPRLDCTKITSVYYEYVDFTENEGNNYDLRLDEGFKFAAYDYLENNEGNVVPVLYDWYGDEGIPKNDKFFYIGKETIDGVVYDKWRKIDNSNSDYGWDSEGKIYFYTNEIVEYTSVQTITYTFESSVINDDGTLVEDTVESVYIEMLDSGFEVYDNIITPRNKVFIAYDYLENNKGETVPVIYRDYDGEIDIEQPYYHVGRATIEGVEYDKWRKIEPNTFEWDSEGRCYFYTNVITIVSTHDDGEEDVNYFANTNLAAWELKYCLDNDKTRFVWADSKQAITNIESGYSNGEPLVRQPGFDGMDPDGSEYQYAWGTQADVDDGDPYNFWYSKNEVLAAGDGVYNGGEVLIVELADIGGKGVIYYMKDEHNNECPYDFKNIQYKRYMITETDTEQLSDLVGHYLGITNGHGYTVDESDYIWCYTFSWLNENDKIEDLSIVGPYLPNDENQYSGIYNNRINALSACMEYLSDSRYGTMLNDIVLLSEWSFDDGFFEGCCSNTFGNNCYYNTFGNDCCHNTFGNDCCHNTFGNNYCHNTFGNYCYNNTFGNYCRYNTFGNDCCHNTFGNNCYYNTFGNNCDGNTFGNNCYYNIFEQSKDSPLSYIKNIRFADECNYIKLLNTETPSSSNYIQNITVSAGVSGTSAKPLELQVSRNAAPVVFEAAGTTHIILD